MKTELENIIAFFNENEVVKECISVKRINELAELPDNTLNQVVKGYKYRKLSQSKIEKLIPVIEKIGYKRTQPLSF